MKLLVIHWGNNGGGPKFGLEMAKGFSTVEGVEVYVSYSTDSDIADKWAELGVRSHAVRTYQNKRQLILGIPRLVMLAWGLRCFIRENQIDVVYSAMYNIWQSLALPIYLGRGVRFFASVHDASDHPGEQHWLKELCRRIEVWHSHAVVVYSDYVRSSLQQRLGVKRSTIHVPHGVDQVEATVRCLNSDGPVRIGFFGRLSAYKGLTLYVDALRLLQSDNKNRYRGVVYGAGEVDAKDVSGSAEFIDWNIGWVADEEIDHIFKQFDILALPYVEASQSGVLALAVGRGVPVIATPVGGLQEQVSESGGGLMTDGVGPSQVAAAIRELAEDRNLYLSLSQAGLKAAATSLSWPAVASSLAEEIKNAVES